MNDAIHSVSPRAALLRRIGWLLVIVLVAAVFGPTWLGHVRNSLNPMLCNDDARIWISPFLENLPNGPVGDDIGSDYIKATGGIVYRALYGAVSHVVDPRPFSGLVGHFLFLATVVGLGIAVYRIGGVASVCVVVSVLIAGDVFLERSAGGMPRACAFPLLAWALAALVHGRMRWLGVVVLLSSALYPSVMVPIALTYAVVMLLFPPDTSGIARPDRLRRRLVEVAVVGAISVVLLLPTLLAGRTYGHVIPSGTPEYPESGPGGRLMTVDLAPYRTLPTAVAEEIPKVFVTSGEHFARLGRSTVDDTYARIALGYVFAGIAFGGFLALAFQRSELRRVGVLGVTACLVYLLAVKFSPHLYLPQRYVAYPVPILVAFILAVGPAGLVAAVREARSRVATACAVLGFGAVLLITVAGPGNPRAGLNIDATSSLLYPFVGTLPREALLAGWPEGDMDGVAYFAARRVFLTHETHHPFHTRYVEEMRRRTDALMRAYFATEQSPIDVLRSGHGVTHMLVDRRHFQAAVPRYIEPFNALIADLHAVGRAKGFLLADPPRAAVVFEQGDLMLIDVARLGGDRT